MGKPLPFRVEVHIPPGGYATDYEKYSTAVGHVLAAIPADQTWVKRDTDTPDVPNDILTLWEGPDGSHVRIRRIDTDPEHDVSFENTMTARVWSADDQDWAVLGSFKNIKRGDLFQRIDKQTEVPQDEGISLALKDAEVGDRGLYSVSCRDIVGLETQLPT